MSERRERTRSTLVAVVVYTIRACLPATRRLALLAPCAGALLFGLLAPHVDDGTANEAFATVAGVGLFALVLPISCLVVGDSVLGAEVRSGAFSFTWLSPVPFTVIVLGRWLAGLAIAGVTVVPAMALAALVAGAPEALGATVAASIAGVAAYLGLFLLIGCATRRAAVWSLAVVFLVEGLLGEALTGVAQLSPTWQSQTAFAGLAPGAEDLLREGIPDGSAALVRLALITVVTLALATWRLARLELTAGSD
ncbi:hypothetical protein BH20ACT2_BH20ACT2_23420 [soil metagenome]